MITTLIIFLLQITLAIGIILGFNATKTEIIQENRNNIAFSLFSVGVFNLIISLIFLSKEKEIECIFYFLFSLPWFWWFEKQTISVHNNHQFNMYRRYTDEIVVDTKGIVELEPGEHCVPYPWFKVSMVEHGNEEILEGFDTQNNIVEIADFYTLSRETLAVSINEIECELELDKDFTYQFDFFSYKGVKGQNGVVLFIISQIKDALKHFVAEHSISQMDNPFKVRSLFETGGHHQKMLLSINSQIRQFKVNVRGKQEPLSVYSLKLIKIGEIKPSDTYLNAVEQRTLVAIKNDTNEKTATAQKELAKKLGITLEKLMILQGIVEGYDISGNNSSTVPFLNINPEKKKK